MPESRQLLRSLTARYVVALALVAVSATVAFLVLDDVIGRQRDEAAIVNVAGRQRMLSQKIAFLAAQLTASADMAVRRGLAAEILDSAQLMEVSHRALTEGDPDLGIQAPASPTILQMYQSGPLSVTWRVENYISAARALATVGIDAQADGPAYREIAVTAPEILAVLDQVVLQYQQEGEAKVGLLARLELAAWLTTLLVLALEALFIFRPMMRNIRDSIEAEEIRRAAAEAQAKAGERRNATLLDTIADAVVTTDSKGIIRDFSRAAEAMFGYGRAEVLGKSVEMLMPVSIGSEHADSMVRYLDGGPSRVIGNGMETVGLRADGSEFPLELALGRWDTEEGVRFTAVIRDITERRAVEEAIRQAQKMEVVGQLSGGVAHDFNNLLGIISGNLEILETLVRDDPKAGGRIATAQRAVDRGADLTRKLLAFARKKGGNPKPVNVNDLIAALGEFLDRLRVDRIEVVLDLAAEIGRVSVDPGDFQDCILNLALNARDAMQHGGTLTISTRAVADGARAGVAVIVADTGTGIPEVIRSRIFEPFFTTKEAGKGTGLGLSMVYAFAKRSGGEVEVSSVEGKGTVFTLVLPRVVAVEGAQADEDRARAPEAGHEAILIVDDEADLRDVAQAYLSGLGYRCHAAGDGKEALEILAANPDIRLMVSDVVMPGDIDGIDLTVRVAASRPDIKIILASGFPARGRTSTAAQVDAVLDKPYRQAELAGLIRTVLDRS